MGLIFDLDLTLINSSISEQHRKSGNWSTVYQLINRFSVYDGIFPLLTYANSKGISVAIVSSSPSTYCQKVIDHWNFNISNKICYHDTKLHKPHPAPITAAVNKYFTNSKTILSFGDRAIDIEASNAANVISVGCLWGSMEKELLKNSNAKFVIEKPLDAIKIIDMYF